MAETDPEQGEAIRLGIIASSLALRTGLRAMLAVDERLVVAREGADLSKIGRYAAGCDVLLIDQSLFAQEILEERDLYGAGRPDTSPLRAALGEGLAETEVLPAILALGDDPGVVGDLLSLPVRAWGVLSLDASAEELIAAIHALHEGLIVAAPHLFERGLQVAGLRFQESDRLYRSTDTQSSVFQPATFNLQPATISLTPRETQVLQLLAQGLANKQIARALGISEHTIKFHVSSIYGKLGVGNRTEAVRVGVRQGLILL